MAEEPAHVSHGCPCHEGAGADIGIGRLAPARRYIALIVLALALPRLSRRPGVPTALLDQLLGDREAHERAPDVILRVSGDDRGLFRGTPSPSSARISGATRAIAASRSAEDQRLLAGMRVR
jgi:hypothetical protein